MLAKRIIPCLDVAGGRVVKGVHFEVLRDAGDPVELAAMYEQQGADEIVFLDIAASIEERDTLLELVSRTSEKVFVPFTVGGGVRTVEDMGRVLAAGADKVSVNTRALAEPDLIDRSAKAFGSQCVVVAIDAKRSNGGWQVYSHGGRTPTGRNAVDWAREAVARGAGELLLTSIDTDGTKRGYDIPLLRQICSWSPVPVVASGGAGEPEDFRKAFDEGGADAALAASVFHYGTFTVGHVKDCLLRCGVQVRPT
jgi:imidazole glycerol-phosphate synthase subunit HisF